MEITKVFFEYLRNNDLKITPERITILNEVLKIDKHFEANTLFLHLLTDNIKISRATIYRTLELLVDCGLVKKIHFGKTGWFYEPNIEPKSHDHFLCTNCGKIIEFYDNELNLIHKKFADENKLIVNDYSHQLYGKCSECMTEKIESGN